MIVGITTALNISDHEFPYELSIRSWLQVCDEIVIVTNSRDKDLHLLMALSSDRVKVRGVAKPLDFDTFRFIGYFHATCPKFVVHFDLDYIISPISAKKLRETLWDPQNSHYEVMTYILNYLNYHANKTIIIPQLKRYNQPYNGWQGTYPLITNPRRQTFICPYEGVSEENVAVNAESVMSLDPKKWGKSFDMKFMSNNPNNFDVLHTNIEVEHLSFSLKLSALQKKLQHVYWREQSYTIEKCINGHVPYPVTYPLLEQAREKYKTIIE